MEDFLSLLSYLSALGISIVYFIYDKNENIYIRLFTSAHGVIFVLASWFSIFISQFTTFDDHKFEMSIMFFLYCFGVVSMIFSLACFRGKPIIHLLLLYNLIFAFVILLIAGMYISHDWL